jgi:hypothetical protein
MIQSVLDTIWDFLRRPVYYGAIHVHVTNSGEQELTWCIGKVVKDELVVTDSGTHYDELLKAKKKLFVDPLFGVSITGQPVLVKSGEDFGFAGQGDAMVSQVVEFGSTAISSVARKDALTELLMPLQEDGVLVGAVYIGPSVLCNEQMGLELPFQYFPYQYSENGVLTPLLKEDNIGYVSIEGENILRTEVLARATLVSIITQFDNIAPQLNLSEGYNYEIGFKKVAIAGLPVLFLLTVVGYLTHANVSEKRNNLQSELNRIESTHKETLKKAELVSRTKSLLGSLGSGARYALYLDSLAQTIPAEIQLQELKVNPNKNRKLKAGKPIQFDDDVWIIEGLVKNANILDDWIVSVNQFDWIVQTHIDQYGLDDVHNGYQFQLKVEVNLDQK